MPNCPCLRALSATNSSLTDADQAALQAFHRYVERVGPASHTRPRQGELKIDVAVFVRDTSDSSDEDDLSSDDEEDDGDDGDDGWWADDG